MLGVANPQSGLVGGPNSELLWGHGELECLDVGPGLTMYESNLR